MTDHPESHEAWAAALRAHGRRVTKQRLAVLAAVEHHPHSPAENILAAAREELPELTAQSVYVVLGDLTDLHMLRRFEPPHSPALYETRVGDNHHHAICISCGRVEDVDCAVGHAPCLTPALERGFPPHDHPDRGCHVPGDLRRVPAGPKTSCKRKRQVIKK
jgi:Fe2+ or Zn2+ uptake regulation protein